MKEKILEILINSKGFVSGQEISEKLSISRNSVWKYINKLKEDGYIIEGVSRKGYRLIKESDIPNKSSIKKLINTKFIGSEIYDFYSLDSTNLKAKSIASKGFLDGSIVISRIQTKGSGRFNRTWGSPLGGLWSSIILKPNIDPQIASKLTIVCACALFKTIKSLGLSPKIKWPNDIYIKDKKCAGILTTMNSDMDKINYLIIGVGLNVNIPKEYFIDEFRNGTSLSIELNKDLNLPKVYASFLNNFEDLYLKFVENSDLKEVFEILKNNSKGLNEKAKLVTIKGTEDIVLVDIDKSLELIVKTEDGTLKKVLSGEITFS